MTASAHDIPACEPPRDRRIGRIGFRTTEDESLLIHKAAELQGWTVTQYVVCAVLDRAERDLYEYATRVDGMVNGNDAVPAPQDAAPELAGAAEQLSVLAYLYGR
jgi:uncharacterized protein (DUF1778 family)